MLQFKKIFWSIALTEFTDQNNLTAAENGSSVYVRINGRGSFRNSPNLKEFVTKKFEKSSPVKIFLDMKTCSGMDSTFMGVLAGLSILSKKNKHSLSLTNISTKNEKLLKTLGVNKILTFSNEKHDYLKKTSKNIPSINDKQKTTKTSLEAHKQLVKIDKKNKLEFKSVIDLLETELKNYKKDK